MPAGCSDFSILNTSLQQNIAQGTDMEASPAHTAEWQEREGAEILLALLFLDGALQAAKR